jgi:hypothetical protein
VLLEDAKVHKLREERLSPMQEITIFYKPWVFPGNTFISGEFAESLALSVPKLSIVRLAVSVRHDDNMSDS